MASVEKVFTQRTLGLQDPLVSMHFFAPVPGGLTPKVKVGTEIESRKLGPICTVQYCTVSTVLLSVIRKAFGMTKETKTYPLLSSAAGQSRQVSSIQSVAILDASATSQSAAGNQARLQPSLQFTFRCP